jgi:mannose/fructose/N-acetylgalactosamine-specific phosphotransferase system component IID
MVYSRNPLSKGNAMFRQLAEKNLEFYNTHPGVHTAVLATYTGVAVVVLPKLLQKIAGADTSA